jgi:hypothetical protein
MYYWQEQSEADARAPDTMGAPVPPTQQPVAGRAQSGWSLPCRLPAESKRSAPARLPAPARGCPALPLVPALLLASECSRRLRGRHATLIITTPLSGGRPATARHPPPGFVGVPRAAQPAVAGACHCELGGDRGPGPSGQEAPHGRDRHHGPTYSVRFCLRSPAHRIDRVVAIAFGVSSATPAKPVLCCAVLLPGIYTQAHTTSRAEQYWHGALPPARQHGQRHATPPVQQQVQCRRWPRRREGIAE